MADGLLRLKIVGVKEVRSKLEKMQVALRDFDELWDRVAEMMIDIEEELFSSEGATAIPVWPPLAESTIEKKTRMGLPFPEMPMVATGKLWESLTSHEAGELGQGRSTLGTFTENVFSWGTDVENERGQTYAEFHQDGPHHNPQLPVRNVINVTPELLARLDRVVEDWLDDALKEAGFGT